MWVLVCGDRNWSDYNTIYNKLKELKTKHPNVEVINGGCRGADKISSKVCKVLDIYYEEYPARWKLYGRAAGPIRNRQMLDIGPELVLAFHNDFNNSKGTKDCVSAAKSRGVKVVLVKS